MVVGDDDGSSTSGRYSGNNGVWSFFLHACLLQRKRLFFCWYLSSLLPFLLSYCFSLHHLVQTNKTLCFTFSHTAASQGESKRRKERNKLFSFYPERAHQPCHLPTELQRHQNKKCKSIPKKRYNGRRREEHGLNLILPLPLQFT